jgi:NAD(P)-dependent dehydrogenase (short-subunit alcohol dehydrogenase family)
LNDPWPAKRRGRAGYAFVAAPVDAADSDSCARAVDDIRRRFGPVSVLVSNAGVTQDASLRKMTRDPWQQVPRVNLDSMSNMTKPVIEDMPAAGWGRVVNISSVNGRSRAGESARCRPDGVTPGRHGRVPLVWPCGCRARVRPLRSSALRWRKAGLAHLSKNRPAQEVP